MSATAHYWTRRLVSLVAIAAVARLAFIWAPTVIAETVCLVILAGLALCAVVLCLGVLDAFIARVTGDHQPILVVTFIHAVWAALALSLGYTGRMARLAGPLTEQFAEWNRLDQLPHDIACIGERLGNVYYSLRTHRSRQTVLRLPPHGDRRRQDRVVTGTWRVVGPTSEPQPVRQKEPRHD